MSHINMSWILLGITLSKWTNNENIKILSTGVINDRLQTSLTVKCTAIRIE